MYGNVLQKNSFIAAFIFLFCVLAFLYPLVAFGYRMPEYKISEKDWTRPAEEVFEEYSDKLSEISSEVLISKLENQRKCYHSRLTGNEKQLYAEYVSLKVPYRFWKYVVDLKKHIVEMNSDLRATAEADLIAKMVIEKLYSLSNEYKITGSALIHNALINLGSKKQGFCYHYTNELRKMLLSKKWSYYDFHWGAAYDKTFLENNALVVTAKDRPFETGIVIDAWRRASKPYWHKVSDDRYPWKELRDVHIAEGS